MEINKRLVEHRTVKKRSRYFIALILTLAVFIIGLLIGVTLTTQRTDFLRDSITKQKLDYDSLQMQYLYLIDGSSKNCEALDHALESNIKELENTRVKLDSYLLQSISDDASYNQLKREYMLAEIRYWILSEKTREVCKTDSISLLYFYDDDDSCLDCRAQGRVLTVLKDEFSSKLMIFSVDANFEGEPMIEILKEEYNVTEVPTIVVQGTTQKYGGLMSLDDLRKDLENIYKEIQ